MLDSKKWWEFKMQATNEAELYLYIEIADWGGGYCAHSAQSFKAELDSLGNIDVLNMYINSPGGDVFEGSAIYNMLKRKPFFKNVYIDGLAASIVSMIATVGDKVIMPSNTMMMIHNAWGTRQGDHILLRKAADDLERITGSMKQAYLEKSNGKLDEETLTKLMDDTTWLSAQECFDYGLCDEVVGAKQIAAKWDGSIFNAMNCRNLPENVLNYSKTRIENSVKTEEKLFSERIKNKLKMMEV